MDCPPDFSRSRAYVLLRMSSRTAFLGTNLPCDLRRAIGHTRQNSQIRGYFPCCIYPLHNGEMLVVGQKKSDVEELEIVATSYSRCYIA